MIVEFIGIFFSKTWELFQIEHPAIGISFWGILSWVFSFSVAVAIIRYIFGLQIGGSLRNAYGVQRKANNKNIKISKERSGDTH